MQIYILIGQDRQGPFTPEELTAKLEAGELNRDALAWREGLDGWQPIGEVLPSPEIAALPPEPPPLPVGPRPMVEDAPKSGGIGIDGDKLADFLKGYGPMLGRLGGSPKPDPLKWYDRFPVVFGALFLFWPLGILCVWLTKRIEATDKLRLTVAGVAWGLVFAMISGASGEAGGSARRSTGETRSADSRLAVLNDIAEDAFGRSAFKRIDSEGDEGKPQQFLQVYLEPVDVDAKDVCINLIEFFQDAYSEEALEGVEFVTFHFAATLIFESGREEKMEILRIALSRATFSGIDWKNYDKYLHHEMFKRHLLRVADDLFFVSKLDWHSNGWRE